MYPKHDLNRVCQQFSPGCPHEWPCIGSCPAWPRCLKIWFCPWAVTPTLSFLQEFVNPDMVPFVLPSALYIAQEVSVCQCKYRYHSTKRFPNFSGKQSRLCGTCSSKPQACDEDDGAYPNSPNFYAGTVHHISSQFYTFPQSENGASSGENTC